MSSRIRLGQHVVLQVLQRLAPASHAGDPVSLVDQDAGHGVTHVGVVVDDQDGTTRKLGQAHRR
jgi:hypothetical protein